MSSNTADFASQNDNDVVDRLMNDLLDESDDMIDDHIGYEDWQDHFDDEVEEDYLVLRYGPSMLVQMAREPEHVQKLLDDGATVTANAMFAAIDCGSLDTLGLLLATGADPDMRLSTSSAVSEAPDNGQSELNVNFSRVKAEWYPLQLAAHRRCVTSGARDTRVKMMELLLGRGANIYALFRQPLRAPQQSLSPEQMSRAIQDAQGFTNLDNFSPISGNVSQPSEGKTDSVRSLLHSLLEDGGHVFTILNHHRNTKTLDIEHRDPQGRTLLLSACRSSLGADARVDSTMEDVQWDPTSGAYRRNPFDSADADSPLNLFSFLLDAGANPLATDHSGKNLLHHLLDAQDPFSNYTRPPMIQWSLQHVLESYPMLLNQPDKDGVYPIHAAFQLWHRYPVDDQQTRFAGLDTTIEKMLAAGAHPVVRDGHENTLLHYVAFNGTARQSRARGETKRRICAFLVSHSVDISSCNDRGKTALDVAVECENDEVASILRDLA